MPTTHSDEPVSRAETESFRAPVQPADEAILHQPRSGGL